MRLGLARWLSLVILATLPSIVSRAQPPSATPPARAVTITSVSGDEASIDAGADVGLAVGTELRVSRASEEIGRLVLVKVDNTTSLARVFPAANRTFEPGDAVALPSAPPLPPAVTPDPEPPARRLSEEYTSYNQGPRTIVPWEAWEYMALTALAIDGALPGYSAIDFQGNRLFTTAQIAEMVGLALENFDKSSWPIRDAAYLKRLTFAYRHYSPVREWMSHLPEPLKSPGDYREPDILDQTTLFGAVRAQHGFDGSEAEVVGRIGGIYNLGSEAWLYVSGNNLHDLYSSLPDRFEFLDSISVNAHAWNWDWSLGKQYQFSGPMYAGDALLSNNSPGIWQGKGATTLSWGKLGRWGYSQIYGGYADTDRSKYFGLRRMETRWGKWSVGLGESYVSTEAPNPLILVLPFYGYQHWEIFGGDGNEGNETFNYMAQVDVSARVWNKMSFYLEFFLDDITAPASLGQGAVERKVGLTGGIHYPGLLKGKGELRLELYQSDPLVYMGISPQVGYDQKDLLLGSPFGGNTQAFFGRFDYAVGRRTKTWIEVRDAVQYKNDQPEVGDRLLTTLGVTYSPKPGASVMLRAIPQRYRGVNYTDRETAVDVVASYAF